MAETIYELADELKNENEKVVMDMVHRNYEEKRLPCECRECLLDITAITLNSIPSRYSVSLMRGIYETNATIQSHEQTIQAAIEKACDIVKLRPHHF